VAYVVSPAWIVAQYLSGAPHIALVFGQGLLVLIGLFLLYCGHDFCRTCCPYGMAQSISSYQSGKWRPLEVHFTGGDRAAACKTCSACQQVCPVDIDPRDTGKLHVGQFEGCFNCGECIDACKTVFSKRDTPSLLRFKIFT
jgi:polyferredoxin